MVDADIVSWAPDVKILQGILATLNDVKLIKGRVTVLRIPAINIYIRTLIASKMYFIMLGLIFELLSSNIRRGETVKKLKVLASSGMDFHSFNYFFTF